MRNRSETTRRRYNSVVIGDLRQPVGVPQNTKQPSISGLRSAVRIGQLKVDMWMLLAVITLLVFGLIMVYSASYDYSLTWYKDATTIFERQLLWLGIGLVGMVTLAFMDYHMWRLWAVPAIGVTILLLLVVLFANNVLNGAARTLWGGSVQPSELAKMITVVYLSVWLHSKRDQLRSITLGLIPMSVILGVVGALILLQPDLSAAITIVMLGGLLFFLAGGDLRQIFVSLLIAIIAGYLVIQVSDTGRQRLADYSLGVRDPSQGSYHVRWAFGAFVKGGWLGTGIGQAEIKMTGLPVPPTDSIFAVIGEETGVAGAIGLVALYLVVLWRGLTIARRAPDEMGALLAAGLSLWIVLEAFINMAVILNLLPFAGNALPFISAGGSSLVMSLAAVGVILNVSRLSVEGKNDHGRLFHAVVDLRRRDGRRGVSGAGSVASARKARTARHNP